MPHCRGGTRSAPTVLNSGPLLQRGFRRLRRQWLHRACLVHAQGSATALEGADTNARATAVGQPPLLPAEARAPRLSLCSDFEA